MDMDKLTKALDAVLLEKKDKPQKPELDGKKRTSSEGAHRPDKGVKFIEMRYDDQFKTKANPMTLKP